MYTVLAAAMALMPVVAQADDNIGSSSLFCFRAVSGSSLQ